MGGKATTASWLGQSAFGAAASAAIFAGVQPSRLILGELPLSGGVAPGYSQYSLPGWIVSLPPGYAIVVLSARLRLPPPSSRAYNPPG